MTNKIRTRKEIIKLCQDLRNQGQIIVTTNGSFDLFHYGHVLFLQEAKKQGDVLIVGVNTNESVKLWKKKMNYADYQKRPLNNFAARCGTVAALESVDYVTDIPEADCLKFIEDIKPDVHVNGADYGENCIEAPLVKKLGGRLHIVELAEGFSTSSLINKILDIYK